MINKTEKNCKFSMSSYIWMNQLRLVNKSKMSILLCFVFASARNITVGIASSCGTIFEEDAMTKDENILIKFCKWLNQAKNFLKKSITH